MANKVKEFLERLSDPTEYVLVPDVAIFDEHEEEGEPDSKGKPGKPRKFTKKALQLIADRSNARDKTGTLCPISLGHTDPGQNDATKQPPIVGFARNYRVAFDPALGRNTLRADYYIRASEFDTAQKFPRTSIELWPGDWIVDPVALLSSTTPARDVGMWIAQRYCRAPGRHTRALLYAKQSLVLRYSLRKPDMAAAQYAMDDAPDADAPDADAPDQFAAGLDGNPASDDPAAPPTDDKPTPEEHEMYCRHCASHPLAMKMAKHYAMEEAGDEPAADPTGPPDADDEPDRFAASFPSSTNGSLPGGKAKPFARGRTVTQDVEAIRYARLQSEVAALRAERDAEKAASATADARRRVTQLESEGYAIKDPEAEVLRFARRTPAQRDEHESYIRENFVQAPVGRVGRVDLAPAAGRAAAAPLGDITAEHSSRAQQYMRTHKLGSDSWNEAVEKTRQ